VAGRGERKESDNRADLQVMRLATTSSVPEGALLARDVQIGRADGIPLLRAGVQLNARYRDGLARAGIHAVYIEDNLSEGIDVETLVTDETRSIATRAVADAYKAARTKSVSGKPLEEGTIENLSSVVERILQEIESTGGAALALADLCAADGYTFQHSVDVTALGLLIGRQMLQERGWLDYKGERRFNRFDERLLQLGLGLVLHDIGKLVVPVEILQKPTKLTAAEWELMKTHPRAGFELLSTSPVSPLVKSVVLRHHERWNGTGYPDGRQGTQIHEMARIAAVADVYDAVTSERPYCGSRPQHEGVRIILDGCAEGLFDPSVVEVFSRLVAPFPPGVEVDLTDGRRAIVVSVPEAEVDRPLVRVISGSREPYEISLQAERSIDIVGWESVGGAARAVA
jgi:HD-GYP domain-containing protein (c-di-GMP phosphodiesterase class II)